MYDSKRKKSFLSSFFFLKILFKIFRLELNWITKPGSWIESNRIKSLPECIVTPLMNSDTFMQMSLIYYSIMVNFHENSMIFQPNFQNICWMFVEYLGTQSRVLPVLVNSKDLTRVVFCSPSKERHWSNPDILRTFFLFHWSSTT